MSDENSLWSSDARLDMPPTPGLTMSFEDILLIVGAYRALVPGCRMVVVNRTILYEPAETGTTRKGLPWLNGNVLYRENCSASIRGRVLPWLVGKGIDVGCGIEKITADCIGMDNGDDFHENSDADVMGDITDLSRFADGEFDWLYSSHSIEHVKDWRTALSEWCRVVRPGGIVFLYAPWPERQPLQGTDYIKHHTWNPTPSALKEELDKHGVDTVECDDDVDVWGAFVLIGRKQ